MNKKDSHVYSPLTFSVSRRKLFSTFGALGLTGATFSSFIVLRPWPLPPFRPLIKLAETIKWAGAGAISARVCSFLVTLLKVCVRPGEHIIPLAVAIINLWIIYRGHRDSITGAGAINVRVCSSQAILFKDAVPLVTPMLTLVAETMRLCSFHREDRGNITGAGAISVKACSLPAASI